MNRRRINIPDAVYFQEGPGVRNTQFTNEGVKLLNVGNINNNTLTLSSTKVHISNHEAFGRYKHFLVEEGDLVIGSSGITLDTFHKKIAWVSADQLPLCLNTSTIRFKALDPSVLDIRYFAYFLQTPDFKGQLAKQITGSAQLNFGPSHLKRMTFPLPPIDVQRQISDTLDKAAALRRKDQELLQKYDELAQSIFNEMFDKLLDSQEGKPFAVLAEAGRGNFTNGPFGSDLLTSELTDSGVPVIYIRDIRNGVFQYKSHVFVTPDKAAQLSACRVTTDDVLIAKVGDPPGAAAVFPPGVPDSVITQDVIRIRPDKAVVLPKYLQYYLNSGFGKRCLAPIIVEGTRSRFGLGELKKLKIPVPDIDSQRAFTERILLVEKMIDQVHQQTSVKSGVLFNALLSRYFA